MQLAVLNVLLCKWSLDSTQQSVCQNCSLGSVTDTLWILVPLCTECAKGKFSGISTKTTLWYGSGAVRSGRQMKKHAYLAAGTYTNQNGEYFYS